MDRRRLLAATPALFVPTLLPGQDARAQGAAATAWPGGPVTLVVPFPSGGPSDTIANAIASGMQAAIGQPVRVEHRTGGSGETGAVSVARSAPDGRTLVIGTVGLWAIAPSVRPRLGYDPVKDFTPVTVATTTSNVLVVNPRAVEGADDLIGLMLWLKRPGASASYASSGVGSADHLAAELFRQALRVEAANLPQEGTAPMVAAVVEGKAQFAFVAIGPALPHIRAGRLKPIMVTAPRHSPLLPEVPTAAESGQNGFDIVSWHAVMAPAGLPGPVLERVHGALTAALRDPGATRELGEAGFEMQAGTPAACADLQQRETARWRKVARRAGLAVS